jgi:hypothetical protein
MDKLDKPTKLAYPNADGTVSIVVSTGALPIEEVGRKDVPAGLPFKFIADDNAPKELGEAWTCDFSLPDGYGIGSTAWFAEQDAKLKEALSHQTLN